MAARKARCVIRSNKINSLLTRFDANVQKATDILAKDAAADFAIHIKHYQWWNSRNGGRTKNLRPFKSRANMNSIYWVITSGETNYEDAKAAFQSRANMAPHYAGRSTADLTFDFHDPKTGEEERPGRYFASTATVSLILGFWEYGHNNSFTGRWEVGPTITPTVMKYTQMQFVKTYFTNLLQ